MTEAMELSLDTSGAVAASTSTTVDGQIILPAPSGQESLVPQCSEIFLHVNLTIASVFVLTFIFILQTI